MRRARLVMLLVAGGATLMVACGIGGGDDDATGADAGGAEADGEVPDTTVGGDDGATLDASVDATVTDTSVADANAIDASALDGGDADVVVLDTSVADTDVPDTNGADAHADGGVPDANGADAHADGGVADANAADAHDAAVADASDAAAPFDSGDADPGVVVNCPPAPTVAPPNALSNRVFGAYSFTGPELPIYDITSPDGGTLPVFATVDANGWIGPMLITTAGQFFVVTHASDGSIFEISAGGDQTAATPVASKLYPGTLGELDAMARDANGNFYVTNSGLGMQPIAVVSPAGVVSYLPRTYDNPEGVVVCGNVLVITEGNAGTVVAHDLTTHRETIWASGFYPHVDHVSAQMVVDHRGHLVVLWSASSAPGSPGLYDLTYGGDFSAQAPLSLAPFRIDVNGLGVNAANDVFAAGDSNGDVFVARFAGGGYAPFESYAPGLTDTESVVVGP